MINITISIILILLSLIFRKSKFLSTLFFLFMWSLWGWNTWNGDFDNYEGIFENSTSISNLVEGYEIGYSILNYVTHFITSEFRGFMILVSFVTLFIVYLVNIKYSKYPALFSAIYFIIFIMEYVYIRNYLVHSILLIAFLLVFKKVQNYKIWFVLLLLIVSSIHTTAFLLLVFLYAVCQNELIDIKKALGFFTLFVLISVFFFKQFLPMFSGIYASKVEFYMTTGGLSTSFISHLLIVLFVYYYFKLVLINSEDLPESQSEIYKIVVNVNIVSLFFLGIYYHIPYFSRILRFLFTFNLIFMLSAFSYIQSSRTKLMMSLIILSLLTIIVGMFLKSTLSLTLYPLYLCNSIWGEYSYIPDFDYE